jgi:hypothetical protein
MKKPHTIIAETLGTDSQCVFEYRYWNFRDEDSRAIYWIGDDLYCIGKRPPVINGISFEPHPDQMFARISGTTVWVGTETTEAA